MAGQLHGNTLDGHAGGARVKSECAAPQFGMSDPTCAADQSSDAGKDLFDPERLRDIVVRPAVNPLYFFVPASARGQDEHGRFGERFRQLPGQEFFVFLRADERAVQERFSGDGLVFDSGLMESSDWSLT